MKILWIFLAFAIHYCKPNLVLTALQGCNITTIGARSEINVCIKHIITEIRKENRGGSNGQWGLVRLEPMAINEFVFRRHEGSINLNSIFSDVLLHGVSNYTITDIDSDYDSRRSTITAYIPNIVAEGKYNMSGNLFLIEMKGVGDFWIELDKISISIFGIIVESKTSPGHLSITDTVAKLSIQKANSHLTNLFDNDPILDETVHHFINTNDQLLMSEILPAMEGRMSKILEDSVNVIFTNIPVSAIYPNGLL